MWALRYYWLIRPTEENPWRLGGSLIHTCYQYHFASMLPEKPRWFHTKSLEQALVEQATAIAEPVRTQLLRMAVANYDEFQKKYHDDPQYLRPIAIEEEFSARLGDIDPGGPWPELDDDIVTCRSDLVYENSMGIWVMDYKSHGRSKVNPKTGELTRWYEDGEYAISWQVLMNLIILRARYGTRVRGFVIQRTTRQEPYRFDRHPLTIPQLAYEEAPRVARELVKKEYDIVRTIESGGRPSPRFHACYGRFGPCDYAYVCRASTREEMHKRIVSSTYKQSGQEEIMAARSRLRVVR